MSVELHREAEHWMSEMDMALARGDYAGAALAAERAATFETLALERLRQAVPERVRTISIIEESADALRARATEYATRAWHG